MQTKMISGAVELNPTQIMQTGLAFWPSKVLLTAVNLNLFTLLADGGKTGEEIRVALNLQQRGLYDFLDALTALQFLQRDGNGINASYINTLETDAFLDKNKPSYLGGLLEMANNRLFPFWNNLEQALKTGLPQSEVSMGGLPLFETLYADEKRLESFLAAMGAVQMVNFMTFAKQFDFSGYHTHCDIGGAGGDFAIQLAIHQPQLQSSTFDLPAVSVIAQRNINERGVGEKVKVLAGNFFTDDFPKADIITMGNILHDWNLEEKKQLIAKAYEALPSGGALVIVENIIDDERKQNAFGLMMSLNMLIETYGGFDYSAADFTVWAHEAGFRKIDAMHLNGPSSALIAYK